MRALIIEDDVFFTRKLKEFFEKNDIRTSTSYNAEEAEMKIKNNIFDVILLDMALPGMNGKEFLQLIRSQKNHTPVVVLSATDAIQKKTEMLNAGADDYVIKPCHASELLARVKAVARRSNHKSSTNIATVGEISIDLNKKEVRIKNEIFVTTSSQYKIMELMVRNKGNIVSKENLIGYLYNPDDKVPHKKILDVFFCQLRKRISEVLGKEQEYIKTCWGVGYKLMNLPPVYYLEDNMEDGSIIPGKTLQNSFVEGEKTQITQFKDDPIVNCTNYNLVTHG